MIMTWILMSKSGDAAAPEAVMRRPAAAPGPATRRHAEESEPGPRPRGRGQKPELPDGFDHFGCSKCKKAAHGCARCKKFADNQEKGFQWLNGSVVRKVPQDAA